MTYTCNDCGMDFETESQLANHKKKFCMGAQGSEEAIQKRIEELRRLEHDLDYDFDSKPIAPVSQPPVAAPASTRNAAATALPT